MPKRSTTSGQQQVMQRLDVQCTVFILAEIEERMLEQGSGFMMHALEQNALHILKTGKNKEDFYLTVSRVAPITPTTSQKEECIEDDRVQDIAAVRGAIIGALAGGHLDLPHNTGYAEGVLLNIADLLHIELPAIPPRKDEEKPV